MICPNCAVKVNDKACWNCSTVCTTVDPITKLRRRVRDMLNKAPVEKVIKAAEVLGVE